MINKIIRNHAGLFFGHCTWQLRDYTCTCTVQYVCVYTSCTRAVTLRRHVYTVRKYESTEVLPEVITLATKASILVCTKVQLLPYFRTSVLPYFRTKVSISVRRYYEDNTFVRCTKVRVLVHVLYRVRCSRVQYSIPTLYFRTFVLSCESTKVLLSYCTTL